MLILKAIEAYPEMKANGTRVQLVRHGNEYPYVIEVTTPGWRGCDHARSGTLRQTIPADLTNIRDCLAMAGVKYYSVSEPVKEGLMMFNEDGTTEFVLKNMVDFQTAIIVLTRAGWLSPEMPPNQAVQ